ncbi:MAG: hypothetical protein KIT19_08635 [Phycisphaeraceae bacterium]|nr:hypothetical protein [Phycisphaeraceae bacterium]
MDEAHPHSKTRLAPSPTGALHLGNARTFLINWAMARQAGWSILLRIEDLDGPRIKPGADTQAIDTLAWLGIDWDEGPFWQSRTPDVFRIAMQRLAESGLAYPTALSRSDVDRHSAAQTDAASAPQEGSREVRFPASLRPPIDRAAMNRGFDNDTATWRFVVEPGVVDLLDRFAGHSSFDISQIAGDFIVWTKQRVPAYQLAVVVDDARQGITEVVRGDDLLDSAARQLLLYRALGLPNEPTHTHLPLVKGPDGRRLAKRHGDTRLDTYRSLGVPPQRVIGLIAYWCAMIDRPEPMSAAAFLRAFSLDKIPKHAITFSSEDDAWLRRGDR